MTRTLGFDLTLIAGLRTMVILKVTFYILILL